MPINFKHAERVHLYRDEQGGFRQLSLITKSVAAYLLKLVDRAGGWLPLHGRQPWDAVRVAAPGACGQGDRRILRRAITELLEEGYLELGALVDGELLPCEEAEAEYMAIRNWVPAQNGCDRDKTTRWHEERLDRAKHRTLARPSTENQDRFCSASGPSPDRACTESGPSLDRACTEISASPRNSKGTDLALIPDHSGPFRRTPQTPQGAVLSRPALSGGCSSPRADKADERASPSPADIEAFARPVIAHLNARVGRSFKPDGANLRRHIGELIRDGTTVEQACAVIDAKCAEWLQPKTAAKMARQLKPDVLLKPPNFRRYLEEDVDTGAPPASSLPPGDTVMAALDRRRAAGEIL